MSDERSGRELTPREPGPEGDERAITPVPEPDSRAVERFSSGPKAHMVGLTEERSGQIVRQSGNARNLAFLAVLVVSLFIPVYWFYENGIPAIGADGRLALEAEVQYVVDVERGYELYQANCAECHGDNGQGGAGPPLNDQGKLYNALTADGDPGTGHLNPNYIDTVLTVGGRYVCGDPNSIMQAWREPNGPLNYRQVEELIAWITASQDIVFEHAEAAHGVEEMPADEAADAPAEGAVTVRGWRDPDWTPAPGSSPPPACWRPYANELATAASTPPPAEPITPGTADAPRVIQVKATNTLQFTDAEGAQIGQIAVLPGETVAIEVENTAGLEHNFYIGTDEQLSVFNATTDVGIPTWTEGVQTVTWTVPEGDGLRFGCTIPGHYTTMNGDVAFQEAVAVDSTDGDDAEAAGEGDVPAATVDDAEATPAGPTPAPTTEAEA